MGGDGSQESREKRMIAAAGAPPMLADGLGQDGHMDGQEQGLLEGATSPSVDSDMLMQGVRP
jgi:hypothetical protein